MDQNSLKHTDSGNPELLSIRWLRDWLRCDGENCRSVQVLLELAEQTERCLERGEQPPVFEMEGLKALVYAREGGCVSDHQVANKWLPRVNLETWWNARKDVRTNQIALKGLTIKPELVCQVGGGRGNVNRFSFKFVEQTELTSGAELETEASESNPHLLRYTEEQLKAAFWFSWLLPGRPVNLRSLRGWIVMGGVMAGFLVIVLTTFLALMIVNHSGPVRGIDISWMFIAAIISAVSFLSLKPWLQLPEARTTIAPDYLLRSDQLFGQLRMIRNKDQKLAGWVSLVRYSAACTICAGAVELSNGRRDFPGRIIGRCRDSPLEHVFSFDPVSLSGKSLR